MAYIGFDARQRPVSRPARPRAAPRLAWGRLLAVALSLGVWAVIIAGARLVL